MNKRTGEVTTVTKQRTQKSTNMEETDDARTLISTANTPMEQAYAEYANYMKSLANQARYEESKAGKVAYSPTAKKEYAAEVESLNAKLEIARSNAPKERHAQLLANASVQAMKKSNPDMTKDEIKKKGQQALTKYRAELGAKKQNIQITDKEWEAIQAGAISENKLKLILNNSDKALSYLNITKWITTSVNSIITIVLSTVQAKPI